MYNSTSELIRGELSNNTIQPIYNIFEDSTTVFKELMDKEQDLFKGTYLTEFKGRLINYIIKRSFDIDRIPKNFPFEVSAVNMACGQKRTELKKNNLMLTLGKAQSSSTLPSYSRYKQEYSKGNSEICKQLRMDVELGQAKITDIPYYGIITYNLKNNKLEFLNIVIPDSNYKYVIDYIPITPSFKILENDLGNKEEDEERLLGRENIKKEILEKMIKLQQEMR